VKGSADNIVSPNLVPATKRLGRESFDTGGGTVILEIRPSTDCLRSSTQLFNGGSIDGWRWGDAELQPSVHLEVGDPSIIVDHGARIIESPEHNLIWVNCQFALCRTREDFRCSTLPYLLDGCDVLAVTTGIWIDACGLSVHNRASHFWATRGEGSDLERGPGIPQRGLRRRSETKEVLHGVLKSGKIANRSNSARRVGTEEPGRYGDGPFGNEGLVVGIDGGIVDLFDCIEVPLCEVHGRVTVSWAVTRCEGYKCKEPNANTLLKRHGEAVLQGLSVRFVKLRRSGTQQITQNK